MATWTDNQAKEHRLQIDVLTAMRLKKKLGVDVLACLKNLAGVEPLINQVSDPATLIAVCAEVEGIPDTEIENYFTLWNGDSFESASVAFLEALFDFFPQRPREILQKLMNRICTAKRISEDTASKAIDRVIESMDFTSMLNGSAIRGNGFTESAESLEQAQKA